jgi:uncharacterized membrane protein
MMTVTGVTFSITIVTLTLASQQYTPRLLRHFTSDRGNQVVLGVFLATFIYSLLVLRTIGDTSNGEFVPHIAVTTGVVMGVGSLAVLIYFIHHVAASIQASTILARVGDATHALIDHLFPEPLGSGADPGAVREQRVPEKIAEGAVVPTRARGYVQAVDQDGLMRVAEEENLRVRLEHLIGDFVYENDALATVWPAERVGPALIDRLNRRFALGRDRTLQQDPEYGVIQLSDIAVKALSPGINDPTTAVTCLDTLGSILRHLAGREIPSPYRRDSAGTIRVIAPGTDFERMTGLALRPIRHYGENDASVTLRLVQVLTDIATAVPPGSDRRAVLRELLTEIDAGAERGLSSGAELARARRHIERAREILADCPVPNSAQAEPHPGSAPARHSRSRK